MDDLSLAVVAAAVVAGFIAFRQIKSREWQRRMEIIHAERLVAMDKGIPLPELPLDPPKIDEPQDPRGLIFIGILLIAVGVGAMIGLGVLDPRLWGIGLPVTLLGFGFLLFYWLTRDRATR
jgi:hypothetical protein